MRYLPWLVSPFILISLTTTEPSLGQSAYSNGTPLPAAATLQPPSSNFVLDSNVTCPSPSLSVSAFGGNAYDRAYLVPSYNANGGSGNYGASVGLLIPISGDLNQFCRDIAASRSTYEKLRVEAAQLNNYVEVAKACTQLAQIFSGMREDDPSKFYDNPQNAQLLPCRDIVKQVFEGKKSDKKKQNQNSVSQNQEQPEQNPSQVEQQPENENVGLGNVVVPEVKSWQEEPFRVQIINPLGLSR